MFSIVKLEHTKFSKPMAKIMKPERNKNETKTKPNRNQHRTGAKPNRSQKVPVTSCWALDTPGAFRACARAAPEGAKIRHDHYNSIESSHYNPNEGLLRVG